MDAIKVLNWLAIVLKADVSTIALLQTLKYEEIKVLLHFMGDLVEGSYLETALQEALERRWNVQSLDQLPASVREHLAQQEQKLVLSLRLEGVLI